MPLLQPNQTTIDALNKILGAGRGFVDFLQGCLSKSLAFAGVSWFAFMLLGMSTMEADAVFAWRMFGLAGAVCVSYVVMDKVTKCFALRVLEKRAISADLSTTIEKVGG
jgi:hypothetical protein